VAHGGPQWWLTGRSVPIDPKRYTHTARHSFALLVSVVGAVILTAALVPATPAVGAATGDTVSGPAKLVKTIAAIEGQPRYQHADWGIQVLNQDSGKVLASQNSQELFVRLRR
jgi:beta-lactamase class A